MHVFMILSHKASRGIDKTLIARLETGQKMALVRFLFWMDPLNGNSSDKVSFHETIKKVENFRSQVDVNGKFKWIADSALYTKERLLKNNDYVWVTRVPENNN